MGGQEGLMSQKLKTVREVKTQGVSSKFEKMLLSFSCESETSRGGVAYGIPVLDF